MAQEVAVQASVKVGWPPERFNAMGSGFFVSDMTVEHFRELSYGERTTARTWMRDFRRQMLAHREVRLSGDLGPVARVTQRWVHVNLGSDGQIRMGRAPEQLVSSFTMCTPSVPTATVPSPSVVIDTGRSDSFEIDVWLTWMDTYGHVNHPMYVDFADEALARTALEMGIDPQGIVPVAERVRFRQAAVAGDRIAVETSATGVLASGAVVFEQIVRRVLDDAVLAQITIARDHLSDPEAWRGWWLGPLAPG
jgi:acyl-CoA thioesterase FadM